MFCVYFAIAVAANVFAHVSVVLQEYGRDSFSGTCWLRLEMHANLSSGRVV